MSEYNDEDEEQIPTGRCPLCGDCGWPEGRYCRYVYRWVRGEPMGDGWLGKQPSKAPPPELVAELFGREQAG